MASLRGKYITEVFRRWRRWAQWQALSRSQGAVALGHFSCRTLQQVWGGARAAMTACPPFHSLQLMLLQAVLSTLATSHVSGENNQM